MYCNNCGKEVKDGQKFCAECGAQIGAADAPNTAGSVPNGAGAIGNSIKLTEINMNVVSLVIILICGVLMLTKTIKLDALWSSKTVNIFEIMSDDHSGILKLISVALYAVTAFKMVISGLNGKKDKKHNILSAATSCLTLLLFIFVFAMGKEKADAWGADIALSASGIAVVIGSIVNTVFFIKPFLSRFMQKQKTGIQ